MMSREEKQINVTKKIEQENHQDIIHKRVKKVLKFLFLIILIFSMLLCYMHFIGAKGLTVREYKVDSSILPSNFHGFKIVHFSDLHYLTTVKEKELNKIVEEINSLKPDIVVFTGDLVDSNKKLSEEDINTIVNYLNKIISSTGLYTVKGNNDYDNDYFEKIFNQTDFKILDNSYDLIYNNGNIPLLITGIGSDIKDDCDIDKAYSYSDMDNLFIISLLHEPDIIDKIISTYHVDLALAGHTHNGQIRLPGKGALFKVQNGKNYPNEFYTIGDTKLYVSGGLGTSKYEFRLFNRPSINLYRLTQKEA